MQTFWAGVLFLLMSLGKIQAASYVATYNCVSKQDSTTTLKFRLAKKDDDIVKIRALNQQTDEVATNCDIFGTGTDTNMFRVDVTVQEQSGIVDNNCEMQTTQPNGDFIWKFRLYDSDDSKRGPLDKNYFVRCPRNGTTIGWVSLSINVEPGEPFGFQFAQNGRAAASLNNGDVFDYEFVVNPSGAGASQTIQNAKGIFVKNCDIVHSTGTKSRIIKNDGCRDPNSPWAPSTDFQQVSGSGVIPIVIRASGALANNQGSSTSSFLQCDFGTCPTENDPKCLKTCGASGSSEATAANTVSGTLPLASPQTTTQAAPTTTESPQVQGNASASASDDDVIIGVVGAVAGLLLLGSIAGVACCLYAARKGKNKKRRENSEIDYGVYDNNFYNHGYGPYGY